MRDKIETIYFTGRGHYFTIERYLQQSCYLTLTNSWISMIPELSCRHLHARQDDGVKETCSPGNIVLICTGKKTLVCPTTQL